MAIEAAGIFELKDVLSKQCVGHCPDCGIDAQSISWFEVEFTDDNERTQSAICDNCGCEFTEVYKYVETQYIED